MAAPLENNMFFIMVMKNMEESYYHRRNIPRFFAVHLPGEVNLETEDGNSCRVSVKELNGTYYFSKGWSSFVRQNLLKTYDLVVFQLTPNEASRITVSIFDTDMLNNMGNGADEIEDDEDIELETVTDKKDPIDLLPTECNLENPWFQLVLKASNFDTCLPVPMYFCREFDLLQGQGQAQISIQTDKDIWKMNVEATWLMDDDNKKLQKCATFTAGWMKLVNENQLMVEDVCTLEMVKNDEKDVLFRLFVHRWDSGACTFFRVV